MGRTVAEEQIERMEWESKEDREAYNNRLTHMRDNIVNEQMQRYLHDAIYLFLSKCVTCERFFFVGVWKVSENDSQTRDRGRDSIVVRKREPGGYCAPAARHPTQGNPHSLCLGPHVPPEMKRVGRLSRVFFRKI